MQSRAQHVPLVISLVVSVLAHITIIVPVMVEALTSTGHARAVETKLEPDDIRQREIEPDSPHDQVRLGVDAETPATFTWIGYEEYQQHLAALSQIEQAAFTDQSSQPRQQQANSSAQQALAQWMEMLQLNSPDDPVRHRREQSVRIDLAQFIARLLAAAQERTPTERESQQDSPKPDPTEDTVVVATEEVEPSKPAQPADRESDPTSIIEVSRDQWRLGKPLAAQGLEIRPRRPDFTLLTLMTAAPANPLCRIDFDSDGVPVTATILASSGDGRVDSAILASLYRWRANGKQLESLNPGQSLPVRIQIILNRR